MTTPVDRRLTDAQLFELLEGFERDLMALGHAPEGENRNRVMQECRNAIAAVQEITILRLSVAEWERKAANWIASPEAAHRLSGYREIAAKCAELESERDGARAALTAAEKRVSELEMQSRGNWVDAEQLAAVIRHAVWEADNQAGVIDVDKLRAALGRANAK